MGLTTIGSTTPGWRTRCTSPTTRPWSLARSTPPSGTGSPQPAPEEAGDGLRDRPCRGLLDRPHGQAEHGAHSVPGRDHQRALPRGLRGAGYALGPGLRAAALDGGQRLEPARRPPPSRPPPLYPPA